MRFSRSYPWSAEPAECYVIQATILYEDLAAGLRANALMDAVHSELGLPALLKLEFWEFDSLSARSVRAVSVAGGSAIVVISASNWKAMPAETEDWIIAWLQRKKNAPSALVALLPQNANRLRSGDEIPNRLLAAAKQEGVDIFREFWEPVFNVKTMRPLQLVS